MQAATIVLGMIVAVTVLILVSSFRMGTQGTRGPQGQFGPNQPGPWPQQPGSNPGGQQQPSYGGSSALLQFFALIGVLVILGACGLMVLALQGGMQ